MAESRGLGCWMAVGARHSLDFLARLGWLDELRVDPKMSPFMPSRKATLSSHARPMDFPSEQSTVFPVLGGRAKCWVGGWVGQVLIGWERQVAFQVEWTPGRTDWARVQ